jgi:hypothetical protein
MSHKKRKVKHRRRVRGGFNLGGKSGTGLKLLSIAAGYFMADTINEQIDKVLPTHTDTSVTPNVTGPNQTMGSVGSIGIGGLLLMKKFGTGTMSTVLQVAGGALAGAGLKRALKQAGVITGYQSVPVLGNIGRKRMTGYQSVPVLGKIPGQLQGRPAQLQGYIPAGSAMQGYTSQGSGAIGSVESGSGVTNYGSGYMQ